MFIFQAYEQKREHDEDEAKESRVGIKSKKKFLEETIGGLSLAEFSEQFNATISATEKKFKETGLSDFISTLTPGAQNAIYAASFAWGYENAAKYVKNAMKLEEVKNALDSSDRSMAVVESIQAQAQMSEQPEKISETLKFVWGFYNEDLKEVQAQAGKSEHLTERLRHAGREKQQVPQSPPEAVALSIAAGSHNPALLYCAASEESVAQQHELQASEKKKEELARLVYSRSEQQKAEEHKAPVQEKAAQQKTEISEEAARLAQQRREELIAEYEKAEKKLEAAIGKLDELARYDKEQLKKLASMLPSEISRLLLAREKQLSRRRILRAQLVKWMAFCRGGRQTLLDMPPSRLLKLVFLSSLLRIGK